LVAYQGARLRTRRRRTFRLTSPRLLL
jgi:hypothetical protein